MSSYFTLTLDTTSPPWRFMLDFVHPRDQEAFLATTRDLDSAFDAAVSLPVFAVYQVLEEILDHAVAARLSVDDPRGQATVSVLLGLLFEIGVAPHLRSRWASMRRSRSKGADRPEPARPMSHG